MKPIYSAVVMTGLLAACAVSENNGLPVIDIEACTVIAPVENLHVGKAWGVPVKIDGTEVYVGPEYVSDDGKFYCLVAEEDMPKLTDDGDVNQAIVVVDVK